MYFCNTDLWLDSNLTSLLVNIQPGKPMMRGIETDKLDFLKECVKLCLHPALVLHATFVPSKEIESSRFFKYSFHLVCLLLGPEFLLQRPSVMNGIYIN